MGVKGKMRLLAGWGMALLSVASLSAAGGDLRLVEAVKSRDRAAVRTLLRQRIDVNTPQADGATALAWAAHWDDLETADLLIRAGANVNAANDYGVTPLSLACGKGSAAMVETLLKARANPNAAQWMGETALMTCARTGNVEAVKSLLARGPNVNVKETRRGQTALMWAAAEKHPEVVRALIERGADVNARSHMLEGFQPLLHLTYGVRQHVPGEPDTFEAGDVHPDPISSKGGFTALMFAAQQGDPDSAQLLLAAGANVNDATPDYGSALVVASASGHEALSVFLLEKGADPNVADGWGFTPLHYALQEGITAIGMNRLTIPTDRFWFRPNMPELAKALLARGADPNARVGKGFPPFDYPPLARTTGNAMPQIRQPGATPFLLAAASFDVRLMRLLVASGANPLLGTEEGTTPLMVAAGVGREELTPEEERSALEAVRLAAELGVDVNAANRDGRAALHGAAYLGADTIIQFLADQGATLAVKDMYGLTALSIAQGDTTGGLLGGGAVGADKRFRTPRLRKSTAELLLRLGAATPSAASPAAASPGRPEARPGQ